MIATSRDRGTSLHIVSALLLVCSAACSGDDDSGAGPTQRTDPFGNASGDNGDDSSSDTTAGGSGNSGGSSGGDEDLAAACKHVDLAIAVDGSSSMTEELKAMRSDIFPAFAQRLQRLGADLDDFRVATLDACPMPANFHTRGAGGKCDFEGGHAWIESSSSAIDAEFACVGDIYLDDQRCSGDNDDEQPASTLATALEEPLASGENAGFHRDDALLIAVAITDEDEQPTGTQKSAEEVYARLAAVAGDDPRRMVFLGIGGGSECQGAYGDAQEAIKLRDVVRLFEAHDRGVFWDLCQGRLEDGLDEAFRVIEKACDDLCDDLDEDCGSGSPPRGGMPLFCQDFPDDPSCMVD